ncbi:hypothetical protein [Pseudomonas sp. 3-2]|uniref:hypothetical protein n=1 Tax=Pseudomonas sp. 3-2 TaxID=2867408 RepID=UPI001C870803|nr:hypothetical protein [Pseudomonas sp. 3-2]QZD72887.1 hypothetical protein K3819_08455 [Pseudomonas sp. 3-2]
MFAIESLDIVVSYRFVGALILAIMGCSIVYYIGTTVFAKRKNKDLSHRLKHWHHIILMRAFNFRIVRVLLISIALCGSTIGILILIDLISAAAGTGLDFRFIPYHNYLPNLAGIGFLLIGFAIQLVLGNKGIPIPIGNGLSLSYDKGAVLAVHLDEDNPDIRSQEPKIKAAIAQLRASGHNNEIKIKSWLCVTRLPRDNADVKNIRHIFSESSSFNYLLATRAPRIWLLISEREWYKNSLSKRPAKMLRKLINTLSAIIYTLINARKIRTSMDLLPETGINQSTTKMMETIRSETGETVTPIHVAPVPVAMFMSLGLKIPHISQKFMGLDGGFTVRPK